MEFNLENDNETFGFYSLKDDNLTNKKFYFLKIILCNKCLLLFFGMIMTYLSKMFF